LSGGSLSLALALLIDEEPEKKITVHSLLRKPD
jgi:hypothetical protein